MLKLNLQWKYLQNSLEEKVKFCQKIHTKHHEEVEEYKKYEENMDKDKFNLKLKKTIFKLEKERHSVNDNVEDLRKELAVLRVKAERKRKELAEEVQKYESLKNIIAKDDNQEERLRQELNKLR